MLSRTADHLYWMSRYIERAENTARMLDLNFQLSLLPQSGRTAEAIWRALLDISELSADFSQKYGSATPANVLTYMTQDLENPASIMRSLKAARENARAVRGSMTTDLWETINTTWLDAQRQIGHGMLKLSAPDFFEWVKFRANQVRGVHIGTMIRDEVYHFIALGTFIERADNIARLLDVKFLAAAEHKEDTLAHVEEFYYWGAILRSLSAFENYRKVYRNFITPERVAELLILRLSNPRSLSACLEQIVELLAKLRNAESTATELRARAMLAELREIEMADIVARGMHTYLTDFLAQINDLGMAISNNFLVPLRPAQAPSD